MADAATDDPALDALFVPFASAEVKLPENGRLLFLRARDGYRLREMAQAHWVCQQTFKPFADALQRACLDVREPSPDETFDQVLLLPPRQRDEARALFAQAVRHLAPRGTLVASMANAEGARTGQADLEHLIGPLRCLSKHKCRVFWGTADTAVIDQGVLQEWTALEALRPIADGRYLSRPGLFAWDRVDPASALLAEQLPATLSGRVADLGAGYGYLAVQVLQRCPQVTTIDLYEAEARALDAARANLRAAAQASSHAVETDVIWHNVAGGLPQVGYDAIVSNPPFHQGRADLPQLGQAFIRAAANALQPQGSFWMVANRHLPYETTLTQHFRQVRKVVEHDGFKVIEARSPCP